MPILHSSAQLALDLYQPLDHHELLHRQAHGTVMYWEKLLPKKRWTKVTPDAPVQEIVDGFAGRNDTYLSVNEFSGWRLISLLKSLRCCYVDIDKTADLDVVLDAMQAAKMPAPSFVVFSGRGIHCYWILEPTPAYQLPLWQRVQDALVDALAGVGSDHKARDCTRVLRLVGTVNTKNGQEVRGLILTNTVWTLDELANEVLVNKPKARVFDLAAAGARKQKPASRARTGSIYDWWYLVYRDLVAIVEHHWRGGVADGHRDQLLFLMSVSLSWFTTADSLQDEIWDTARKFMPTLTRRDVDTQMATIIQRAQDAKAGKTMLWHGTNVDSRYRFKAETMREWLGDLIAPELHDHLRALAPGDVIKQRKQARDTARWNDHNTGQGYRVGNEEKRATARLMKAQGHSIREIAAQVGASVSTVHGWVK